MYIFLSIIISFGAKYAGEFMDLPVSGRAQGMGGAYVSLASIAESPFWNPSLVTIDEGKEIFLLHSEGFEGLLNYNAVSFAMSDGVRGLGFALYNVGVPGIPLADDSSRQDSVDVSDWILYLTYGGVVNSSNQFFSGLRYGANVKTIYRGWGEGSAYGAGIDCGLFYKADAFSVGLYIENVTTTILFWSTGTREFIAPLLKTGISYEFPAERLSGRFIIACGLDVNLENKITRFDAIKSDPHVGVEYTYKDRFSGRAGWDKGEMSFGAGIQLGSLRIDYGQSQHKDLGTNSRFSVNFEF